MAIIQLRNVISQIVLSDPVLGQICSVKIGEDYDRVISITELDRVHDQIEAYVNAGLMTYTIIEDPNIPNDLESCSMEAAHFLGNSIKWGFDFTKGTTPSDITAYRMDIYEGEVYVNGEYFIYDVPEIDRNYLNDGLDINGDPAVALTADNLSYWSIFVFVQYGPGMGHPDVKWIFGEPDAFGVAVPPTSAQISQALGVSSWIENGRLEIRRQAIDNIKEALFITREVPPSFK